MARPGRTSRRTPLAGHEAPGEEPPAGGPERAHRGPHALRNALFVLTAAWLVLFAPQLIARQVFVLGDARVYRPFSEFSRERWLAHHERTFWNPYVMTGVAASASLADMRPQYLPDAALDLFERVRLGRFIPLAAPLLAHLMGMWAMAALAWALWAPATVALVWAGLAWGLSPMILVPLAFGHHAYLVSASLLPGMLLAVHALSAARTRSVAIGWGLGLALLAGLQALTGHPQVVAYSGAAVLLFAVERAVRARRLDPVAIAAIALGWGAAIAAAVWLPALRYGAESVRGGVGVPIEGVRTMSIAWRELLSFAVPRIVGGSGDTYWGGLAVTDYPRFFGTSVVALAGLALIRRRSSPHDPRFVLAALAGLATILALGPRIGPLFVMLRDAVPVFQRFRVASMSLVFALPAVALLSSAGVAAALAGADAPAAAGFPRLTWLAPGALLIAGLVLLLPGSPGYVGFVHAMRPEFADELARRAGHAAGLDLVLRALLLAALLLVFARWHRLRGAPALLIALLALDLGAVTVPVLLRASAPIAALTARSEPLLAGYGRSDPTARVLSTRVEDVTGWQISGLTHQPEMRTNDWIRWRAHAYGGEHGTPSAWWEEFGFLRSSEALRALGVTYVSTAPDNPQDSSAFEPLRSAHDETVYRLRGALSRAYMVRAVRALPREVDVARAMLAEGFVADREAYTLESSAAGEYPGGSSASVRWLRDDPDELAFAVDCTAPAFLVVADAWFPGWSARLDHEPVALWRVDRSLRGIAIPAGHHELRMTYRPEGWDAGVDITRASSWAWLLAALAWFGLRLARRRRQG